MSNSNRPVPRIDEIKQAVVAFYKLDASAMTTKRRHFHVSHPRQVAMFLARNLTASSYPLIGRLFGKRDHTTVLYACRAVSRRAQADPALYLALDAIERDVLQHAERRLACPILTPDLCRAPSDQAQAPRGGDDPVSAAFS